VAGEVYLSATEAIERSLRYMPARPDWPQLEVELIVMRLPDRHRLAIRLDYVAHKRLTLVQKATLTGVHQDLFLGLVGEAAGMVEREITQNS
jgi:hypothetical protein